MLQFIRIRNLALMEHVELEMEGGFVAVTGETGAGKSVLLGALNLLAGARADRTIIRRGAEACEVEASLFLPATDGIDQLLEEKGLPPCEDGMLVLQRRLHRDRAPRVSVNGSLTTVSALQALGPLWIDFHGPGEPQQLFSERRQTELVDRFARNFEAIANYRVCLEDWREKTRELEDLRAETQLPEDERAYLISQVKEIDAFRVSPERIEELEAAYSRLSNAQEMVDLAANLQASLESEGGVLDRLRSALSNAQRLLEIDPGSEELVERLQSAVIELEDIVGVVAERMDSLDTEESSAQAVEADMDRWLDLQRRYGRSCDQVMEARNRMQARLDRQGDLRQALEDSEARVAVSFSALAASAGKLEQTRCEAAATLSLAVQDQIAGLGFKNARFEIVTTEQGEFTDLGNSRCRFLFAPNPGEDLLPLNKIASSGETARVMLGIKAVLAKTDETPVLVFDEVDANVGGEIAGSVAAALARIGENHQVFCVTHLPQVASKSRQHFRVHKDQTEDQTHIRIDLLDTEERLTELARMLGDRESGSARQHAQSLLGL